MPLTATNFVNKGPVLHNDLLQFYNLFTGVMVDQPVTFKNTVTVGGNQGSTTVPVKLYGAAGQTSHLLDLYTDNTNANPGWGIGASGQMNWGPGGASPQDTSLSRVATQNGHSTDTAGLLIWPYLEVQGSIGFNGVLNFLASGAVIDHGAAGSFLVSVTQYLMINGPTTGAILYLGNSQKDLIRNPVNNGANLSVQSSDGFALLSGAAGAAASFNAYYDGTNWQWFNTAASALMCSVDGGAFRWNSTGAGTGAITWTVQTSIDGNGNMATNGSITLGVAGKFLAFIDGNTHIFADAGRTMYFGTFNAAWAFRDTSNGNIVRAIVYNQNEGRLGVGNMTAPAAQLHIRGTTIANAAGWANRLNTGINSLNQSAGFALIEDTYGAGGNGGVLYFGCQGLFLCGIATQFTNGATYGQGRMSFATRRNATDAALTEAMSIDTSGAISGVSFTPTSARKLKTDIAVLADPLGIVLDDRVHGVSYADEWSGQRHVGFVADDWLPVLPEVVVLDDVGDVRALDYDRLSAVTFEALKRFAINTDERLKALEERLAA